MSDLMPYEDEDWTAMGAARFDYITGLTTLAEFDNEVAWLIRERLEDRPRTVGMCRQLAEKRAAPEGTAQSS